MPPIESIPRIHEMLLARHPREHLLDSPDMLLRPLQHSQHPFPVRKEQAPHKTDSAYKVYTGGQKASEIKSLVKRQCQTIVPFDKSSKAKIYSNHFQVYDQFPNFLEDPILSFMDPLSWLLRPGIFHHDPERGDLFRT